MERLFSPCTRLRDRFRSQGFLSPKELQELNLDVSTEDLLSAERAFSFAELYAMLGNLDVVAWMTPHAGVARGDDIVEQSWLKLFKVWSLRRFTFDVDGKGMHVVGTSQEHLSEICDIVLRLLAASVVESVILCSLGDELINAPTLAYLMEQCQSLKVLSLQHLDLDENHCRVLGTYSRPDLKIELRHCRIVGTAAAVLTQILGRNQGPTKLECREIDNSVFADGFRGNSRLKSLTLHPSARNLEVGNRELLAIAGALRENKGLVELELWYGFNVNGKTWSFLCDSLKTHPTLEVLDFSFAFKVATTAPDLITIRTQALVEMLKVNTTIHTIHVDSCFSKQEIYQVSVIPYLETNRLRPRVRAIQKTRLIPYRAKVLGRALLATRTDANSFWMLLSGNGEVAFPSRATTITAAANLSTPTTTSATAAAPSVTVTATRASSTVGTSATANETCHTDC
jgi:hypothetical protein